MTWSAYEQFPLHWQQIITKSPELFHYLDLSMYNRKITDQVLSKAICPFVGSRPHIIDISNCFHITDEGFQILASTCGANVKSWRMKSVWDVTAPAILEMSNTAKGLQEVDLSNCRKVSDTLLARIVGWVVPQSPQQGYKHPPLLNTNASSQSNQPPSTTTWSSLRQPSPTYYNALLLQARDRQINAPYRLPRSEPHPGHGSYEMHDHH